MISKLKEKIKNFFAWIWKECKDWHTIVLLALVIVVMYSPVWCGYLLHLIFGWGWCSVVASAYLLFWARPFTPFFPLCIGITLSLKKLREIKLRRAAQTEESASREAADSATHEAIDTPDNNEKYENSEK